MTADARELLFRRIFESEAPYVWRSLRRLGVHDADREDLMNEVFFRVHRALDAYDDARPLKPWLFAFAVRVAAQYRRLARHRRETPHDDAAEPASTMTPPDESLELAERRALVLSALESLDLDRRAVLVMHDLDGTPAPEIAHALGLPEGTVYSRIRAARKDFAVAVARRTRQDVR